MWKIGEKAETETCAKCHHPHTMVIDRRPCPDEPESLTLAFQCLKCYHIFHKRVAADSSHNGDGDGKPHR
jgi:hypothetical protein